MNGIFMMQNIFCHVDARSPVPKGLTASKSSDYNGSENLMSVLIYETSGVPFWLPPNFMAPESSNLTSDRS